MALWRITGALKALLSRLGAGRIFPRVRRLLPTPVRRRFRTAVRVFRRTRRICCASTLARVPQNEDECPRSVLAQGQRPLGWLNVDGVRVKSSQNQETAIAAAAYPVSAAPATSAFPVGTRTHPLVLQHLWRRRDGHGALEGRERAVDLGAVNVVPRPDDRFSLRFFGGPLISA
jgi:hypothetical protein